MVPFAGTPDAGAVGHRGTMSEAANTESEVRLQPSVSVPPTDASDAPVAVAGNGQLRLFTGTPFTFGERFLADHAGQIITDPRIAIVELVANAYDAGATAVKITWPLKDGEGFVVADNGTGMTP